VPIRRHGNVPSDLLPSDGNSSTVESVTSEVCLQNRYLAMDFSGFQASCYSTTYSISEISYQVHFCFCVVNVEKYYFVEIPIPYFKTVNDLKLK
jgi:hypothetical protein